MNEHHPFHPIIYVRGFAATQGEIEDTVADPYMGFNLGSHQGAHGVDRGRASASTSSRRWSG
jgi:hypothetical protein